MVADPTRHRPRTIYGKSEKAQDVFMAQIQLRPKPFGLACHPNSPLTAHLMATPSFAPSPSEATPDQLLHRVASERDKSAFSMLFEHFAPRLNTYMRRLGADQTTAEELVQDTMLMVWRQAASFDPQKASASTWIFTIARNKRIDALRRQRHVEVEWSDPALVLASADSSDDSVFLADQQDALRHAIAELPAEQAELLRLAYYEDMPHIDIAAKRGLPLGTVKSRLRLAMDKLRHHFSGKEV